jgi:cytochrome P450
MLWASANFDDQEFENPNELDLTRVNNRHMTFGRGIHRCLGSYLALLEMRIILQQVFRRLPDFEIDESRIRVHSNVSIVFGYDAVPARFSPGAKITAQ